MAPLAEIKRSATSLQNPSPFVAEAIEQLKARLFYLQTHGEKFFQQSGQFEPHPVEHHGKCERCGSD